MKARQTRTRSQGQSWVFSHLARWLRVRPECSRFRNDEERERIISEIAGVRGLRGRSIFSVLGIVCVVAVGMTAADLIGNHFDFGSPWRLRLTGVAGAGVFVAIGWVHDALRRRRALRHLWRRMAELGIPTCTTCGYDLRGSPGPRCSECGTAFQRVGDRLQ